MLRLRVVCQFAAAAALLCAAQLAISQSAGLGAKLDAAEKKLDDDIKACRPIDVKDYQQLSIDANRNAKAALDAAHAGAPIDVTRVNADLRRANALFDRARAAAEKPCPPPQQQPQNAAPPKKTEPPPPLPPKPPTKGATPGDFQTTPVDPFFRLEIEAEDALDDLDDAMDDCNEAAVKALIPKLEELAKQAHDAADLARAAGKFSRIDPKEADAMAKDLDDAIADAKRFKCILKRPKGYRYLPIDFSPLDQRILYIHNEERAAWHVPALKWNLRLEWNAIGYADHLAQTHELVHAPREGRGIERENLLQALPGWSPDRMMQSWTVEKRDFVPGFYPNVARDGNWLNVSHYSQMIWPTTTDIGCGYAEGGGYGWLVCRYSPGGNKDGKPVGMPSGLPERG